MSPITTQQLLQHMEVGDSRGLFILGSFERRVTLYSQQVRALNLAWSLFQEQRLEQGAPVLVIGGGPAGLTFAAGAARLGAKVTVLEHGSEVLSTFQGNHSRWLHPHIYDWPQEGAENEDAGLPLMNWRANLAGNVARQLLTEWKEFKRAHDVTVRTLVKDIAPAPKNGSSHIFSWNAPGFERCSFQAVVFAVGFGQERQLQHAKSSLYWEDDNLHQVKPRSRILISGIGDGGLVDLFRSRFRDFRHEHFTQECFSNLPLKETREALLALDKMVRQRRLSDDELYDRYLAVPVPQALRHRLRGMLRDDVRVELNALEPHPLKGQASVLNLFIASQLLHLNELPYRGGPIQVSPSADGYEVTFSGSKPESFDRVVVRHGPEPSLKHGFPWLWEQCRNLRERNVLDQTREPLWKEDDFTWARSKARGSPPARSSVLPQRIQCFGRKEEVERLTRALLEDDPRPTTLLGPPGIGKTTITQAALQEPRVVDRFQQRRYFVRLDGATTVDLLIAHTARELGLEPGADSADRVVETLSQAPSLLVLDNAETPWQTDDRATEDFVRRLAEVPRIALVLSIRGRRQLPLPRANRPIEVPTLSPEEATDLFCSIAHNVERDHPLLPGLLESMGYVPLAVVLLAHVAQGASLELTLERWGQERAEMLSRGKNRDSDFASSIEVSLASPRMTEEARRILSALALLPTGVASRDRVAVLQGSAAALGILQQAALVHEDGGRWRIVPPLREFMLRTHPPQLVHRKHFTDFYFQLAREHGPEVGKDGGNASLLRLDPEYTNIEALLRAGLQSPEPVPAIEVLLKLNNFLRFSGHGALSLHEEACEIARALAAPDIYARCVRHTAQVALRLSEHERARALYTQALPLFERLGDLHEQAQCLRGLASVDLDQNLRDAAWVGFERALSLFEQAGLEDAARSMGNCVHGLGKVAFARGHHEEARGHFERALKLFMHPPHALGKAHCLRSLGDLALAARELDSAWQLFLDASALFQESGDLRGSAHCLRSLGDTALLRPRLEEARQWYEQALPVLRRVGSVRGVANCRKGLGTVALQRSQPQEARAYFEQALESFKKVKDVENVAECQRLLTQIPPR